jgi:glycosyltransferase involved in cell wall biosynthesis
VVDESMALLVEPSDPAALGAAIAALVDGAPLRAALGAAALERAAAFRLERRAARIHALLGGVVAAR